ncbi:MAG: hypothetical protein FJ308_03970 [Planctomycetes bacterium]|nr:hypothetical protein [Planctomycetota bacterium]
MPSRFLAIIAFAVCVPNAFAHPGHGNTDAKEVVHYVTTFEHLLPLALMALATVTIVWVATKSINIARRHR